MQLKQNTKKLYEDLSYWIFIGIGDDIVKLSYQRAEYKHIVAIARKRSIPEDKIPRFARSFLFLELKKHPLMTRTFWNYTFGWLRAAMRRIMGGR